MKANLKQKIAEKSGRCQMSDRSHVNFRKSDMITQTLTHDSRSLGVTFTYSIYVTLR